MSLPSRTTAQLFASTVDLVHNPSPDKLEHWKNLVDQGGRIDDTLTFQNPRFDKQMMLSSLEVMFSCWGWETLAKGIEHLPWLSTSDLFFQNIAKNFQDIHMFYPFSELQEPFERWFNDAKRGIYDMQEEKQYGRWGPWETLMYRSWAWKKTPAINDISSVMELLQTLPKIQSTATLKNLHNVATMDSVQHICFGGIMALTVGVSPNLYASEEYQKLSTFIQKSPDLLKRWNTAQEAHALLQQQTLMKAVGQSTKTKNKSTRKI